MSKFVCIKDCITRYSAVSDTYFFKKGLVYEYPYNEESKKSCRSIYSNKGIYNGYISSDFIDANFITEEEFNKELNEIDECFENLFYMRRKTEDTDFTEISALDIILEEMKDYLPENLEFIKIRSRNVGWQQYEMDLDYFDEKWRPIEVGYQDFNEEDEEKYEETCPSDFIYNSLIGMTTFGLNLDYFEFFPDRDYFYECKK